MTDRRQILLDDIAKVSSWLDNLTDLEAVLRLANRSFRAQQRKRAQFNPPDEPKVTTLTALEEQALKRLKV